MVLRHLQTVVEPVPVAAEAAEPGGSTQGGYGHRRTESNERPTPFERLASEGCEAGDNTRLIQPLRISSLPFPQISHLVYHLSFCLLARPFREFVARHVGATLSCRLRRSIADSYR